MSWLQGGPFLELSFLIEESETLLQTINKITNSLAVKIVLHHPPEKIDEFYEGYPFDEDDPEGKTVHQVCLNLTVCTHRVRQSLLFVERINTDLLCFSICFYGSEVDAHEWGQPGIREDEMPEFYNLLRDIFNEIHFIVGGCAFEEDVKAFFDTDVCWPDPSYSVENITSSRITRRINAFKQIIVNDILYNKLEWGSKNISFNKIHNGFEWTN